MDWVLLRERDWVEGAQREEILAVTPFLSASSSKLLQIHSSCSTSTSLLFPLIYPNLSLSLMGLRGEMVQRFLMREAGDNLIFNWKGED